MSPVHYDESYWSLWPTAQILTGYLPRIKCQNTCNFVICIVLSLGFDPNTYFSTSRATFKNFDWQGSNLIGYASWFFSDFLCIFLTQELSVLGGAAGTRCEALLQVVKSQKVNKHFQCSSIFLKMNKIMLFGNMYFVNKHVGEKYLILLLFWRWDQIENTFWDLATFTTFHLTGEVLND